jgi:hypothetical protein
MKYISGLCIFLVVILTGAFAQSDSNADGNPAFTQTELDQMLAPIALYPDDLLSQLLMAATYPLEVVEAARWLRANRGIKGEAALQAVAGESWDASVKSLVAFPDLLATMDEKLDWTERLGDAFLTQQAQVMDTVQQLRRKASQAGYLASNTQVTVNDNEGTIEIESAQPSVVYVPYYDPAVVYGTWWWPGYPPTYWAPWPDYGWYSGFGWGVGFVVGVDFFLGGWDWHHHRLWIDNCRADLAHCRDRHLGGRRTWEHDPGHRRGVPYRNEQLNRQFGRTLPGGDARREFRGHPQPGGFGSGGAERPPRMNPPEAISPRAVPPSANPPRVNAPGAVSPRVNVLNTLPPRSIEPQSARRAGFENRGFAEPPPHAFEGLGRGQETRGFSDRGHQSFQSMPRPSPTPRPTGGRH